MTNLLGTLNFNGGGNIEGVFGAGAGTTIAFASGTFAYNTPPALFGPGSIQLAGGTLTLTGTTIPNLQLAGGTVALAPNFQGGTITNLTLTGGTLGGNLTVSGTFSSAAALSGSLTVLGGATATWNGGSIQGPVTVSAGGTLNISGNSTKFLWNALTNAGTVVWSGNGSLEVDYSTSAGQFGLIQNLPGALWDVQNSQRIYNNAPNGAYFQNAGTLRKSADGNTTQIQIPFNNSGAVTNVQGTLQFTSGGNIEGTFAAPAGTINFNSGAFTYTAPPVMFGPGTIQLTGNSTLTLSNNVIANLQLAGGVITLGPNFQGGAITNLTMTGGTLNGNNTVSGAFNWSASLPGSLTLRNGAVATWTGGSVAGSLNVSTGAVLNVAGSAVKQIWNAMTNAGTVTWSGTGGLDVDNSSANSQFGTVVNLPGALWDIQNSQSLINSGGSTGAFFQNGGTFRKSADSGTTGISIPFTNNGVVTVLIGTVSFKSGGFLGGSFAASAGATITFATGNFVYASPPVMTGPGTIQMTGGTLTLAASTIPNLQLAGGTITLGQNFQGGFITNLTVAGGTLNGNLTVSGTFTSSATLPGSLTVLSGATANWTGGSISGPVNIATGGTLNIAGGSTKFLWDGLTNAGTVTWSGTGNLQVDYSSAVNEFGTIVNLNGALWDIQNSQNLGNSFPNGALFQNSGTVQKSADSGITGINIPFQNSGLVNVLQGTLALKNGGTIEGSFMAATGAVFNLNGGPFTYNAQPSMSGLGTLQLTAGSLTLASNTIPNLQLAGGTITLGPSFQGGTITNLTMTGGTLLGSNTVTGTLTSGASLPGNLNLLTGATVNWTAGTISGTVNIASGAAMNLQGTAGKLLWNALTNAGTITWSGSGNFDVDYSTAANQFGLIQNLPGGLFDIQNDQSLRNSSSGSAYFQNSGTVQKSGGVASTTISIPFFNSGTTKSLQGVMAFAQGVTLSGGTLVNGLSSANNYGRFNISGNASLAGGLNVTLVGNFAPALSNTFRLVSYGSRTGSFAPFTLPPAGTWQSNYGPTALTVTVADINQLTILSSPSDTNAGAILAPIVVQVINSVTSNSVPTSGVPITLSIGTGNGAVSGTVTRNTDVTGKATFNDVSINLVGSKTLVASAPGITPETTSFFNILPGAAARLSITTPVGTTQQNGGVFSPAPVVQIRDAFGNVAPFASSNITVHSTSPGGGTVGGTTTVSADPNSGAASFNNLFYVLANQLASETATIYFTSPGLIPVTNAPVFINYVFGIITLHDGNSVIRIDPATQQGMFSWTVDGAEHLYQQWFWLRQGNGPQVSFDTLGSPIGAALSATNATINYSGAPLNVNVGFALHGGAAASQASDLAESVTIQNTGAGTITLHVFQYADFEMSAAGDSDTVSFPTSSSVIQSGGDLSLTENVQMPMPSFWEAGFMRLRSIKFPAAHRQLSMTQSRRRRRAIRRSVTNGMPPSLPAKHWRLH